MGAGTERAKWLTVSMMSSMSTAFPGSVATALVSKYTARLFFRRFAAFDAVGI
jgi:hypothetical protein